MLEPTQTYDNLILMAILVLSILLLRGLVIRVYRTRKNINKRDNFIIGVNTISLIIILVLMFFAFLLLINIDIKQFFTSISIIAAAIAIVSKDYISNAINGMILMFNTHLSIDDYVKIGEVKGKISNLTLMNVHLINEENDLVLIPNNVVLTTQIINYTKGESRKAQIELLLPKHLALDMTKTELLFKNVLKELDYKVKLDTLTIRILHIEKESVMVRITILLHQKDMQAEKQVKAKWLSLWAGLK
jgi:small-conductance mechanosensitive channel